MTGRPDNVRSLNAPEPERYVTRAELATRMGVSVRQIDVWRKEGMPAESWGLRVVRFRPSTAIQWVRERAHREAA